MLHKIINAIYGSIMPIYQSKKYIHMIHVVFSNYVSIDKI